MNDIAPKIAQPCFTLPTILPNVYVSPAPIRKMEMSWRKLQSGVGFSYGCAELALKKPPPLVPSILIASCEATGPWPMLCDAPSSVLTSVYGLKFCGTPCHTRKSAYITQIGART